MKIFITEDEFMAGFFGDMPNIDFYILNEALHMLLMDTEINDAESIYSSALGIVSIVDDYNYLTRKYASMMNRAKNCRAM